MDRRLLRTLAVRAARTLTNADWDEFNAQIQKAYVSEVQKLQCSPLGLTPVQKRDLLAVTLHDALDMQELYTCR